MEKPTAISIYLFRILTFATIVMFNGIYAFKFLWYFAWHPFSMSFRPKERPRPPCLEDPQYGLHKYLTVNGIRIHYVEKGDQSKPLMLFVHGFPEFWYSWRHQIVEFSKDYWCVAVDLRGFGDSEKPQGIQSYVLSNSIEDINRFVEALGAEKFIFVGHDWGACISWSFRDKYPEKLLGLVSMCGPSVGSWSKLIRSDFVQFASSWYFFFFQGPFLPELAIHFCDFALFHRTIKCHNKDGEVLVTAEDFEAYKYIFSQPGALTSSLNYYRANLSILSTDDNKKPNTHYLPSLYMHAELDVYVRRSIIGLLRKEYPNLEVEVVKDTGHNLQQESPGHVNKAIRTFLRKHKL